MATPRSISAASYKGRHEGLVLLLRAGDWVECGADSRIQSTSDLERLWKRRGLASFHEQRRGIGMGEPRLVSGHGPGSKDTIRAASCDRTTKIKSARHGEVSYRDAVTKCDSHSHAAHASLLRWNEGGGGLYFMLCDHLIDRESVEISFTDGVSNKHSYACDGHGFKPSAGNLVVLTPHPEKN